MRPQSTRLPRVCQHCSASFVTSRPKVARGVGRFCSHACAAAHRARDPAERFWEKVDRSGGPDACWPWLGLRSRGGYGQFYFAGKTRRAHRVAWELTYGPVPLDDTGKTLRVLHDCPDGDNPLCCNFAHLWLGTDADNSDDKVRKGRQARGNRHALTKLTEAAVRAIRARSRAGVSRRAIAREFGVGQGTVSAILYGNSWSWVADE